MNVDNATIEQAAADCERDGYCVIRGFFPVDEIDRIRQRVERYIDEVVPTIPSRYVMMKDNDDLNSLFRLEGMDQFDSWFKYLAVDERLTSLTRKLLNDDFVTRRVEMFGKGLRVDTPTPPHQDGYYFMLKPNNALTHWFPLDRADEENGCIRYVVGSHKKGMRDHEVSDVYGFSLGVVDYGDEDEANCVAVIVDPGDLICHHSLTIHRADGNPSDRKRRAIGIVHYGASCRQDKQAADAHSKNVHARWAQQGKQ